jgi:oligosaccharide repeat unit polymerase
MEWRVSYTCLTIPFEGGVFPLSKKKLLYFAPAFVLCVAWLLILFIREFSLLSFDTITFESSLYLFLFFLSFLLGSSLAPILVATRKVCAIPVYSCRSINDKANLLIFVSVIAIFLLVFKFLTQIGGLGVSLGDITDLRLTRGRDPSDIKGEMLSGILGMMLSGFTIITYIYKEYFVHYLSHVKKIQMNLIFVAGMLTSFLSGGRWSATIGLVVVFIMYLLRKYTLEPKAKNYKVFHKSKPKKPFLSKILKIIFVIFIGYVFSRMFIDRAVDSGDDLGVLLTILSYNFDGVSLPVSHENFLTDYPEFISLYYVLSLFQYYAGHALYQFDVLLSADYPSNAPYLLTYQFYVQVLFLNKMGFDFFTINQILSEIVNPGVYFTLAGAFLLDFGYWGGILAVFIVSFFGSCFWVSFLKRKRFFDMYIAVLYFLLIGSFEIQVGKANSFILEKSSFPVKRYAIVLKCARL